ncbi:DeoR/GlpR family DNA-binding transcription regulator [[Clostridium] innocuum]|nr:DeoR/GlpR family DNA-binding transcription regulator [[Clostridium] innocuum]
MIVHERHTKILELLSQYKKIEVTRLSELLSVSQVTIRKDLMQLESSGLILREHGYAALHDSDDLANRLVYHYEIKQRIASLAVADVQDGETLMIESGSCCALVALEIAKTKKNVTVITNSAFIADYIRKQGTLQIILLGGEYQQSSQVMVGPMTRRCMEPFYVDKLFIGTDGFTADSGFTGNDYMRSETVRDMAQQANHVIVVTESTKFSQKGLVHLIDTDYIHMVVSDDRIPEECEQYLTEQGVEVKKVKV